MAKEVCGRLIRETTVGMLRETLTIPEGLKERFADQHDGCFVVQVSRNRMRVNLAISSGQELIIPKWLCKTLKMLSSSLQEKVSIYLSTRPIWLVQGEQKAGIEAITHQTLLTKQADQTWTTPVRLMPRLRAMDNIGEMLDLAEGDDPL